MSTMTYQQALDYLYHFTDYEKRGLAAYAPQFYNLARVHHLLALLGDPHRSFQSVHIAGTKGKGSTAAMTEAILRSAGYRTGLYTSPHLHTFRERIQVDGRLIAESDVVDWVERIQPLVSQVPEITTFEVMTALAFAWFAAQRVEWAVVEVGLGGRLDATNVLKPAVVSITSISLDHTAILGDTHAKIAAEKAGIIKPGVPVISAPQSDEALSVIQATCQQQGAPLTLVGRDWTWRLEQATLAGQAFSVIHGDHLLPGLWIPLLGEYQVVNATTAIALVTALTGAGTQVGEEAIRAGLRSVHWPGRLEILGRAPFVIADSAHNGDSAQKLMAALKTYFPFRRLIVILGASLDHVTPELLTALLAEADLAIATRSRHPRAAQPAQLQARAGELGFHLHPSETVAEALNLALAQADSTDLICCTGSVFVAAEAREAWLARQGQPLPPRDPV